MKKAVAIGLFLLSAIAANAQTQSPVIAEFQATRDENPVAEGIVSVKNDGIYPMTVTVEAMSFKVAENGTQSFYPLDLNIQVLFDNSSARIAAKGEHVFAYKATCKSAPCFFVIYSSMTGPRAKTAAADQSTMAVALHVPTVNYIYQKTPVRKDELSLRWTTTESNGYEMHLLNNSRGMIRAKSMEAHFADGHVQKFSAFPLFWAGQSGSERTFRFAQKPAYLVIKFPKFTLDTRESK